MIATANTIANRLQNAPQSVIDRVLGYIDAISSQNEDLLLSADQLNELDERVANAKVQDFIPWEQAKKQLDF